MTVAGRRGCRGTVHRHACLCGEHTPVMTIKDGAAVLPLVLLSGL